MIGYIARRATTAVMQIAADVDVLKDKADVRAPANEVTRLAEAVQEKLLGLAHGGRP